MNWNRVEVVHVPAGTPADLAAFWAGKGFTVTAEQVTGTLFRAASGDDKVGDSLLIEVAPPLPPSFVLDTFSGPDMPLNQHVGEIGASWTSSDNSIVSLGVCHPDNGSHIASGRPPSPDYSVLLKLATNDPQTYRVAALARYLDADNYYGASLEWAAGVPLAKLFKVVGGVVAVLGTYTPTEIVSELKIKLQGSAIAVLVNSTSAVFARDGDLTAAGSVGFFGGDGWNEGQVSLEAFEAAPL